MINPIKFLMIFLLIVLPTSSRIQEDQSKNIKSLKSMPDQSSVNSQGQWLDGPYGEIFRQIITTAYIKYGKDKDANAKYITQKANVILISFYQIIVVILDRGTSTSEPPYAYHYVQQQFVGELWAQWDDANPSQNWTYLISPIYRTINPSNAKFSQKVDKGAGVTDAMEEKIREIIVSAWENVPEMNELRASNIGYELMYAFSRNSHWSTLIYRCSGGGIGDYTPRINDLWFAARVPVIEGIDECYFIYEALFRIDQN